MSEENQDDRYTIPHNYTDRGGVFEFFKPRMLAEGGTAAAVVGLLITAFIIPLGLPMMAVAFIIGGPVITILVVGSMGFHNEPWSAMLRYLLTSRQTARKMSYRIELKAGDEDAGKKRKADKK